MDSRQPHEPLPSRARRLAPAWVSLGVLLAVGALLYARALAFGFTHYDDSPLIVGQSARLRDPAHALASFYRDAFALLGPNARGVFYRPILWLSYVVDARLGGVHPGVFHATNLLLDLGACALALALLRRFGHGWRTSLLLALVLLVHPALVSVVGWIPCRNDTLLAIFAIASAFALLAFLERPGIARGAAVLTAVALVLFTKESGVAVLAVLPALALAERGPAALRARPLQVLGAGVAGVALVFVLLRRHALGAFPVGMSNAFGHAGDSLAWLVVYVGKTLLPVELSVHPHRADTSLWPGILALAAALGACFLLRARLTRRFAFGVFWYFAFLLPALLSAQDTAGLEHRLYVPLIGLLVAAAELRPGTWPVPRTWLQGAAVALLAALALLSARRLPDFSSDLALWQSAARSSPTSEGVWRTLAWRSLENDRLDASVEAARRAIALQADEARSHLVLGVALARQGRFAEAEPALREATRLDANLADAWQNLALVQQARGDAAGGARSRRLGEEASAREPR